MKKTAIIFFAFFICNIATAQEVPKIRIDPSKAYGGSVSEYFDNVEYIPLETTKESLFGQITQLLITDSSYIIYDYDTKSVLFFSLLGNFLNKVTFKNNSIQVFLTYDKLNNNVILKNQIEEKGTVKQEQFLYFNNGSFIERIIKNDEIMKTSFDKVYSFNISGCALRHNEDPIDTTIYMIRIFKNDTLQKSFLPRNPYKDLAFCTLGGFIRPPKIFSKDTAYVATPINHIIYRITKDSVAPVYKIIFQKDYTIADSILKYRDKKNLDIAKRTIMNNDNLILDVSNIVINKDRILFKINPYHYIYTEGSEGKNQYNLIYNISSNKLISLERIKADSLSYYLPVLGNHAKTSGVEAIASCLYSDLSSFQMFAAYEKTQNKNPQYPPALQQYFKTQNRKSNPVIVKMKLRE
jgi:hypothetical protein